MTIKKLSAMPYAQAHTEIDECGNVNLFSYVTRVAEITVDKKGNRWLTVNGLYSQTTRKHISAFVKEYCGIGYSLAKQIYQDGYRLCLDTGELEEIAKERA